jgi:hypothetical protein
MQLLAVLVVVLLLVLAGLSGVQANGMSKAVSHHWSYEIVSIDDVGVGDELRFDIGLRPDSVMVDDRACGAWVAPMQVDTWKGLISIGAFHERTKKTSAEVIEGAVIDSHDLAIRFERKTIRSALKAGDEHAARIAQRQLDTLSRMRADRKRPECPPGRQAFIDETLRALSSASSYQLCCFDEYYELELRGDHVVRLEN